MIEADRADHSRAKLDHDLIVPITRADQWSQTPLWLAAENGHEGVVRMLLERNDIKGAVRMLVERNHANPNTSDAE